VIIFPTGKQELNGLDYSWRLLGDRRWTRDVARL
jgi:hypothetical protein